MARRKRIPDHTSAGRSSIVPFKPGEDAGERHYRRLSTNSRFEPIVKKWCERHGFELRITNNDHHWQMRKGPFLAEWWPSSAKLVLDKKWGEGIHCHDYKQALTVIEESSRRCLREIGQPGFKLQHLTLSFTDCRKKPVADEPDGCLPETLGSLFGVQFEIETSVKKHLGESQTSLWDKLVESSLKIDAAGCDGILMKEVENRTERFLGKMGDGELRMLWQETENGALAIEQGFDEPERVETVHDIALDINQAIVDGICEEARGLLKERKLPSKA